MFTARPLPGNSAVNEREEAPCPHSADDILEGQTACARHQQSVPVPVHLPGRPAGKAGLGRAGVAAANQEVRLVGVGCLESLGSTRSPVGSRARVGGASRAIVGTLVSIARGSKAPPKAEQRRICHTAEWRRHRGVSVGPAGGSSWRRPHKPRRAGTGVGAGGGARMPSQTSGGCGRKSRPRRHRMFGPSGWTGAARGSGFGPRGVY